MLALVWATRAVVVHEEAVPVAGSEQKCLTIAERHAVVAALLHGASAVGDDLIV